MRITNINNNFNNFNNRVMSKPSFKKEEKDNKTPVLPYKLPDIYAYSMLGIYTPNILVARQQEGMGEFFDSISPISVEEKSITKHITDFKFAFNPDFDKKGWINFLSEMNESIAVFDSTGEEKTFLSKLLQVHSIDKLLNNPKFKPDKAISFLDELYERTDEKISQIPFTAQLEFMVDAASSNKDIKEYIDDMFYFVELEDVNGDRFLSEYAGQMNENKIDVLIHMLNVDKGSVEASNMQMLFELIQKGVVGKHIFDIIPYDGKVNSFVAADIDKLYSAYVDGIEPIDVFVPPVESHNEAQALLTVGDVYELNGEEKIFILDKDLNPLQLGIDKETYFELFPPIERYAATQNDIGNCWEVTGFNTLLTDPKERYSVLSLFEQNGDEISISFPSNVTGKIVFEDGELPIGTNPNYYSKGSKGLQLLEYAHGVEEHEIQIKEMLAQLEKSISSAKTKKKRIEQESKLKSLQEMLLEDRSNTVILYDKQTFECDFEKWDKNKHGFDNAVTATREGGDPIMLFKKLGYVTTNVVNDNLKAHRLISNPQNFEDYIITFGTKDDDFFFPKDSPLICDHSYRLYPLTVDSTGKVAELKLVDPSGIVEIPMSMSKLMTHNGIFSVARRDKSDQSYLAFR